MRTGKLTVRAVRDAQPGRHGDGGGLYLDVSATGAKRWTFITSVHRKRTEIGLGSESVTTLAAARVEAARLRAIARTGGDPLDDRRAAVSAAPTFGPFADDLLASIEGGFRNEKHKAQWRHALEVHCASLRSKPLDEIATDDVLAVLTPLWKSYPETAARIRGRIERVLDAARARGLRRGENPARWRGHLDKLLPARKRLTRGHHPAMAWRDLPAFYAALATRDAVSALLLRFVILTCARSGEARGARWGEIDASARIWTVPGERMKTGRAHRVPLVGDAVEIVERARDLHPELCFPSPRGLLLSDMCFKQLFARIGVAGVTTHGFRSTFRDWASEAAHADWAVAEACLAHTVGSTVERAYARSDLFERRRDLLERWERFVTGAEAAVVAFTPRGATA